MSTISDPIMVSALEHYSYCPRQCALIHIEQTFDENLYTLRGRAVHENVDLDSSHLKEGIRYERALPIWSERFRLVGKADMVEFHGNVPYPVEYKSGKHRAGHHENLQVCAQAMCLEEMLGVKVEKGAIFWHASRERKEIVFTEDMRNKVQEVAAAVHRMIAERFIPPPVNDKRCRDCSLKESCLPDAIHGKDRNRILARKLFVVE
jgi:CRISPR-associated exonuclease Cas4